MHDNDIGWRKKIKQIERRNKYIKELEAENNIIHLGELSNIVEDQYDLFEDVVSRNQNYYLHKAIQTLDCSERDLIYYLYFRRLTIRSCAQLLGIAPSTCYHRKKKVLCKLRTIIESYIN